MHALITSNKFKFKKLQSMMEASKKETNIVLVVGHASSNSKSLISDVIGSDTDLWTVENKYFSAPVQFVFVDSDGPSERNDDAQVDAVVFVFDPSARHESAARPSFWEPWTKLHPNAQLRLLVRTKERKHYLERRN